MLRLAAGVLSGLVALLLVLFAVANRDLVTVSVDPFGSADPALSARLPLFLVVFLAIILGIVLGGLADRLRSSRHNRRLRRELRRRDEELNRRRAVASPELPGPR
jgi:uncharacterized integral membrane protein